MAGHARYTALLDACVLRESRGAGLKLLHPAIDATIRDLTP